MSDGQNDIARADREARGERRFADPNDMAATAGKLDAHAVAIDAAVRRANGLLDALRLAMTLAGGVAAGAGVPLGTGAVDLVRAGVEMVAREAHVGVGPTPRPT